MIHQTVENDRTYSLKGTVRHEIKVKGSRFIGNALSVHSLKDADRRLESLRHEFYDATHHCFAFRVGLPPREVIRYSDAGEPSGTAGRPIMEALQGRGLTNAMLVVTRYFGGTKLGTGGLARAYGLCAVETLDQADIHTSFITEVIRIRFDYEITGPVMHVAEQFQCQMENPRYGQQTEITLRVRRSHTKELKKQLTDKTSGRIQFLPGEYSHD